ncbi:type II CRISPR RNA-guided endonuclease Cas9 [Weissella soli]|uniref:type II CRISPR RNA-guided endonuclease Cas9 n=1 Tax=Weissella soli TaxID=155866 RepID=UPI001EEA48E3|nr:type II CRISPR RNA-guided endonuclease Cas9 [Weissella soli]GJM47888.1 CRISPR-associated endonuclease Cas9 [Weissella soli]
MCNKQYTIGLDIGTNSVGWAVIDQNFDLVSGKKHINDNGKQKRSRTNLWGVRTFDAAEVAANRRLKRGMRRRIARRKERLNLLRGIFESEILKFDDSFFIRMDESFLQQDDKGAQTFSFRDTDGKLQERHVAMPDKVVYPLFNGKVGAGETFISDSEYYEAYQTIYHLRQRLIENPSQADLRLVYLAIHHILKFRGHFVNQGQTFDFSNMDVAKTLVNALELFNEASSFKFHLTEADINEEANTILKNKLWSPSKKAYELNELYKIDEAAVYHADNDQYVEEFEDLTDKQRQKWLATKQKQIKSFFTGIVGNTISLKDIFDNPEYDHKQNEEFPEKVKYANEDFDNQFTELEKFLSEEELEAVQAGKRVYEALVLSGILTQPTLSASMVEKYELHQKQLAALKQFAKRHGFYNKLFSHPKDSDPKHYGLYDLYVSRSSANKKLRRENFYDGLKKELVYQFKGLKFPSGDNDIDFSKSDLDDTDQQFIADVYTQIKLDKYLPKQRQADNGAIPYQVHEYELIKIIENQMAYYPFLGEKSAVEYENEEGDLKQNSEYKLQTLFKFRIPYYVGTLAKQAGWKNEDGSLIETGSYAKNSWLVRNNDQKITPWNFDKVVNKEESAVNFIERMTNFDTYLPSEKVLPKNSLLYQEFIVYNELISSGYFENGKKQFFTPEQRQRIVERLFKKMRKVTAVKMRDFLRHEYQIKLDSNKELFGLDTFVTSPTYNGTFSTYRDLQKAGITDAVITEYPERFEEIIKWQTIFEDHKILKKTLRDANTSRWDGMLTDEQITKLSKKHYTGWGRLSRKLLDGIKTSAGLTIIDSLREGTYNNFMRLLEDEKIAKIISDAQLNGADDKTLTYDLVDQLAGSPAIKKGIWQSLRMVKELEHYLGSDNISKIVIEMSRDDQDSRRSKTRKRRIEDFYTKFKETTGEEVSQQLRDELDKADEQKLKNDERLFLYFMQNGKSMYSGDPIYLDGSLNIINSDNYQVDHIVPQTYLKDDSWDNKVLVSLSDNQNKGGDTPSKSVIAKMNSFWELLAKNGQVSPRKLANLKMGKISDKQREGFINRQLVENRQITKHVANILTHYFEGSQTLVLTPKAGLTTQFRSGKVYLPNPEFDNQKAQSERTNYKVDRFLEEQIHEYWHKSRDLNDYHHAHDAYLNAIVAQYIYMRNPELKNAWVYGQYERNAKDAVGKWASQRKNKSLQLLSTMREAEWKLVDPDTGEIMTVDRDQLFTKIDEVLHYRNINIVKKTEIQTGKFGDERVYSHDLKAKNFSNGLKNKFPAQQYGGNKSAISALTVITQDKKGRIIPISVSAIEFDNYMNSDDKLAWITERYPKIAKIVVESIPKYSKYRLPSEAMRLLASFQEAQAGSELPMLDLTARDDENRINDLFDELANYIFKNELFVKAKAELLTSTIRENFKQLKPMPEKQSAVDEMLRVTKGSNQNLKMLSQLGLGTTAQQLISKENLISNGTTIINQSVTGLYEQRRTLN